MEQTRSRQRPRKPRSATASTSLDVDKWLPNITNFGLHNLANQPLTEEEKKVLSLGLNFIPMPKWDPEFKTYINNQYNIFTNNIRLQDKYKYADNNSYSNSIRLKNIPRSKTTNNSNTAECSKLIEDYLKKVHLRIRHELHSMKQRRYQTLKNCPPRWFFDNLHQLRKNKDLIITNADKNMGVAIVKTTDYIKEGLRQLCDSTTYIQLNELPDLTIIWGQLKVILEKHNIKKNNKRLYDDLTQLENNENLRLGHLYLLMKVHKANIQGLTPGRPIVSSINTITYCASLYIDRCLQPLLKSIGSYIQSSTELVLVLEKESICTPDCALLCADIDSLYPNIPIEAGLTRFRSSISYHRAKNHPLFKTLNINLITELMKWVLENNYFTFGSLVYHQINGTAMGTPAAVVFACFFIDSIEREIRHDLKLNPANTRVWRYIDDIFGIFPDRLTAQQYIDAFTSKVSSIKCSATTISDTKGVFLDLEIYKGSRITENKFNHKVFQKPQNKYLYLPPNSFHPKAVFTAYISAELVRYRLYCTDDEDFSNMKQLFFERLIARGYTKEFLEPLFNKNLNREHLLSERMRKYGEKKEQKKVPLLFKVRNSPQTKLLRLGRCLKLDIITQSTPAGQEIFKNGQPICCYSNPGNLGSFYSKNRREIHGLSPEDILKHASI
jgi:hypothetical protein